MSPTIQHRHRQRGWSARGLMLCCAARFGPLSRDKAGEFVGQQRRLRWDDLDGTYRAATVESIAGIPAALWHDLGTTNRGNPLSL